MEQNEFEAVLALLKYRELHVRAIAKMINTPHATISRLMNALLKKGVVDFTFAGKNKVFRLKKSLESLNYVYMSEHYKLLKLFEKYPNLSVIADSIISKTDKEIVLLFGSFAKFNAKKDSDIDLFIETNDRKVKENIGKINSRLSVKIGKFDMENLLMKEIIKDHVILNGVEKYYENVRVFG